MTRSLTDLKNAFSGKKGVIVANGPSTKSIDFDVLKASNAITFASNRVSLLYESTSWRPHFYVCFAVGPLKHKEWRESIERAVENESTTCFVSESFRSFLPVQDNIVFVDNVSEHYRHDPVPDNLFDISPEDHFLKSFSATVPMFQLCLYTGVKNIAIVGQDGYQPDREENHFSKDYGFPPTDFKKVNKRIKDVHHVLKKYADREKVSVHNLSKISILDEYPVVEIQQFVRSRN